MTDRKTLHVTRRSFHGRIYSWWIAHGGIAPRRVTLCNYFWAVVLLAPLWAIGLAFGRVFGDLYRRVLTPTGHGIARVGGRPLRATGRGLMRVIGYVDEHPRLGIEVTVAVWVGIITALLFTHTVITLLVIGGLLLLVALVFAVAFVGMAISDARHERKARRGPRPPKEERLRTPKPPKAPKPPKGDGIFKVLFAFLKVKKARVCPFLEIGE